MTLDEAKNTYANTNGHDTWYAMQYEEGSQLTTEVMEVWMGEVAEIYASQFIKPKKQPNKKSGPDEYTSKTDEDGNQIIIRNNGVRLILSLKLRAEKKGRRLGIVNLERKTFEVRRNRDKHLFRAKNSYGFNYKLLEDAKKFDKVRLIDDQDEWLIETDWIMKNGSFLHFKNNGGFERQIFVNLVDIDQFKRPVKV